MASTQAFPPKGRQDTIFNEVTSVIRVPAFVDNTVLHAEYTRERSNTFAHACIQHGERCCPRMQGHE